MAWEQFNLPELDGRLQLIAGYLASKVKGAWILDLNCGGAPLLRYLPGTYKIYIGNDTNLDALFPVKKLYVDGPKYQWLNCADDELPRLRKVDILLSLGYGARLNEHESATLDDSIIDLVGIYKPSIVIIDAWSRLPVRCGLEGLLDALSDDYDLPFGWLLEPYIDTTPYSDRQIHILERK